MAGNAEVKMRLVVGFEYLEIERIVKVTSRGRSTSSGMECECEVDYLHRKKLRAARG